MVFRGFGVSFSIPLCDEAASYGTAINRFSWNCFCHCCILWGWLYSPWLVVNGSSLALVLVTPWPERCYSLRCQQTSYKRRCRVLNKVFGDYSGISIGSSEQYQSDCQPDSGQQQHVIFVHVLSFWAGFYSPGKRWMFGPLNLRWSRPETKGAKYTLGVWLIGGYFSQGKL